MKTVQILGCACIGALLLLGGCDTVGDWFKSSGNSKRIPGERISILALESRI